MNNKKPVYTIGHRNPDTDSICSAISYAALKNALGEKDVIAARAGQINAETKFALDYFKAEVPMLLPDIYPRVNDIMLESQIVVKETDNLRHLGEVMRKNDLRSVPVTDEAGKLSGIITVSDLANRYFQELSMQNLALANIALRDIVKVVDGEAVVEADENVKVKGAVRIAAGSSKTIKDIVQAGDVVLVGDRQDDAVLDCLKQNIACLIVTGSGRLKAKAMELAEELKILVVSTPYDTYSAARLINQCVPVGQLMHKNPITFNPEMLLSDIKGVLAENKFRNYPVAEDGKLVGIVSRDQLLIPEPESLILVDHNERGQAVEGLENAKVLEIVDHHRLGGIETSEPIFTYQEPVGCTATIIAGLYWQNQVEISSQIAGLLLSAIISDTVLFKSPTTTEKDKKVAKKLAEIAGVEITKYGMEMLKAGSSIGTMTPMEIAKNDLKEFQFGDYDCIISQVSVMDTEDVLNYKSQILECMETICQEEGFSLALLMVTSILDESTELLYVGSPKTLIGDAFSKDASGNSIFLPGVMSRKKQIVPPLSEAVKRLKK